MFAGPNGSGKSTLKSYLPIELLGVYFNADEIEQEIRETGYLDLSSYGVTTTSDDVLTFFKGSSFLEDELQSMLAICLDKALNGTL